MSSESKRTTSRELPACTLAQLATSAARFADVEGSNPSSAIFFICSDAFFSSMLP